MKRNNDDDSLRLILTERLNETRPTTKSELQLAARQKKNADAARNFHRGAENVCEPLLQKLPA